MNNENLNELKEANPAKNVIYCWIRRFKNLGLPTFSELIDEVC